MTSAEDAQNIKDIDRVLENTRPRPKSAAPPTSLRVRPAVSFLKQWASSQVAAYRAGLVLNYLALIFFGASAFGAGIPVFVFTTPDGWTPIWSMAVVLGALVGAVGALKAGTEPVTREIRAFNRIELVGSVILFLTLGTYACVLLIVGYGFGDLGRISSGAGYIALGVNPAVRMVWLIFRPRFVKANQNAHIDHPLLAPPGYAVLRTDEKGIVIPEAQAETEARINLAIENEPVDPDALEYKKEA